MFYFVLVYIRFFFFFCNEAEQRKSFYFMLLGIYWCLVILGIIGNGKHPVLHYICQIRPHTAINNSVTETNAFCFNSYILHND